ncbi:MAG: helix-turn-helix domain-containing protein [Defluviitaleaceae bacterium]|nr:helix-turn-helix domain-containing protein [Defluviitaleaceae bacterium]
MTLGQKIKIIRRFRNLTQRQLGVALDLHEGAKNAETRICQYELGIRTPKMNYQLKLAETLKVHPINFTGGTPGTIEHVMQFLFWLEESNPELLTTFEGVFQHMCFHEWRTKKDALQSGDITHDEYFEWKLSWSNT